MLADGSHQAHTCRRYHLKQPVSLIATRAEESPHMAQHPPAWMEALVDVLTACLDAYSPTGPLGFGYREEDERGELIVYPTPV